MENKNISIENGLEISLKVLEELKKHKLNKDVTIGTFTNCRECGLTFRVFGKEKSFTWCVYEHRNSDEIIINGKQAQQGLYFKNKEIRDNFLETEKRLKSLSINVKETIKVIKEQHGKPKNDYGLLSYMAGKI